jgi:pyruvate dehydrogenase E2 component (dihydrolipoamide acetyltransferase)
MALASAIKPPASAPAPKPPVALLPAAAAPFAEVPHSTMRKVIARRLTESKQTVPHFYVTMEVVLDDLLALREQINARVQKTGGAKVSVNDFIIRASALALKRMPEANVSWTDEAMRMYSRSDISVAVATPAGLITPIVRGAEAKSLGAVSDEMRDLAARARDGKLKPEEYQGGTFSISNLGMYGVREFAAIINPPQSMLLAVGASEPRPVVKDGALAIANAMNLTLSCDHRCIDGALGAKFLGLVKSLLEDPVSILL